MFPRQFAPYLSLDDNGCGYRILYNSDEIFLKDRTPFNLFSCFSHDFTKVIILWGRKQEKVGTSAICQIRVMNHHIFLGQKGGMVKYVGNRNCEDKNG